MGTGWEPILLPRTARHKPSLSQAGLVERRAGASPKVVGGFSNRTGTVPPAH